MRIATTLIFLLLVGCGSKVERELTKVQPPTVVTKVVTEYRDIPDWAIEQLPNTPPVNGTIEALKTANNARADWLDYANCRAGLLAKVDNGLKVTGKECRKP